MEGLGKRVKVRDRGPGTRRIESKKVRSFEGEMSEIGD
jgi:hypothetical protein